MNATNTGPLHVPTPPPPPRPWWRPAYRRYDTRHQLAGWDDPFGEIVHFAGWPDAHLWLEHTYDEQPTGTWARTGLAGGLYLHVRHWTIQLHGRRGGTPARNEDGWPQ